MYNVKVGHNKLQLQYIAIKVAIIIAMSSSIAMFVAMS